MKNPPNDKEKKMGLKIGSIVSTLAGVPSSGITSKAGISNKYDPLDIFGGTARDYNSAEAAKEREFASEEAEKQRLWQEEMSNTAHQREVADLKKAGLNPILSVNNGAAVGTGAAATSGAAASTQSKGAEALGALISLMGGLSQVKNANASALTAKKNADLTDEKIKDIENQIATRNLNTAAGVAETNARTKKLYEETTSLLMDNARNELLKTSKNDPQAVKLIANYIHYIPKVGKGVKEGWDLIQERTLNWDYHDKSKLLNELWKNDREKYYQVIKLWKGRKN